MAVDRAVLLPGEDLMQQLDKEYEGTRDEKNPGRVEEESRRMKRGIEAEKIDEAQSPN